HPHRAKTALSRPRIPQPRSRLRSGTWRACPATAAGAHPGRQPGRWHGDAPADLSAGARKTAQFERKSLCRRVSDTAADMSPARRPRYKIPVRKRDCGGTRMPIDPEMVATMGANLKEKTGKDLSHWLNVAKKSGFAKHGE